MYRLISSLLSSEKRKVDRVARMSSSTSAAASSGGGVAKKRALLLEALGSGTKSSTATDVPWPESLYDRVMRTRIEVADVFDRASLELPETSASTPAATNRTLLRLVEADITRCIQRLADALPRSLYQETISSSMRSEYEGQQKALSAQQHQISQQQQQLYNAKRIHQHAAAAMTGESSLGDGLASPTAGATSVLSSPSRSNVASRGGTSRARPASAGPLSNGGGAAADETFAEAQMRHLYSQLHGARSQLQQETQRVEALKAFCIRKDAAVDYIRETLLQEVVTLKEQLRRQDHDPNFISEFVTLFDCWKVLQGDDPSGGTSGNSGEAVRQAKKELQAEAARIQHQFQMSLRKKEDEVADLQRQLQLAQSSSSTLDKKKSQKGKKDSDFHEQFLQLTTDMAKKDVCIADMTEELKQLQTEVAIAQQLARSTRDQLNRSALDIEEAVAVRDAEILSKTELIASLEFENAQLRSAMTEETLMETKLGLSQANDAMTLVTQKLGAMELEREQLLADNRKLHASIEARDADIVRLSQLSQMDSDDKTRVLLQQITTLQTAVASEHALVEVAQQKLQTLETELDKVSSNYETAKFEHTKLRSALRKGMDGANNNNSPQAAVMSNAGDSVGEAPLQTPETLDALDDAGEGDDVKAIPHQSNVSAAGNMHSEAASEALERRLAKEIEMRRRIKAENDALNEELVAVKSELRSLLSERDMAEKSLSASNSVRSPRKVENGSKSPRRRSGSTTKKPTRGDDNDEGDLHQLLGEKTQTILQLEAEVERLRKKMTDDAASQLLHRPAATFAFHVAPDANTQHSSDIPTSDIPNIFIEAAKEPSGSSKSHGGKAETANRKKFQSDDHSQPTAPLVNRTDAGRKPPPPKGPSSKTTSPAPQVAPPARSHQRGGSLHTDGEDATSVYQPDVEVSPFTATLANFQEMDMMDVGHGWRDPTTISAGGGDIDVSFADGRGTSPPPLSDADDVYHRALQGGSGHGHRATSHSGTVHTLEQCLRMTTAVEPRIAVLEASLMDKDLELRRVVLLSATQEEELTALRARVAEQQEQIQHWHKVANAPLSLPSFAPPIMTASRGVSPMTSEFDAHLQQTFQPGAFASQLAGARSTASSPEGLKSPVVVDPPSRIASPVSIITVSVASATQTELTMLGMNTLLEMTNAAPTALHASNKGAPPLSSATPSRQGSAAHQRPSARSAEYRTAHVAAADHTDNDSDGDDPPAQGGGGAVQRVFSAHRRAVHTAGSSVSVVQKSSRVTTETQFYLTGDGVQGNGISADQMLRMITAVTTVDFFFRAVHTAGSSVSVVQKSSRVTTETQFYLTGDGVQGNGVSADSDAEDDTGGDYRNSSLPSGRVLRVRPQGSANNNSNRGGSVGEKLTSAVAVAKGLSDRNKSSMSRRAASEEHVNDRSATTTGGLDDLVARPSSSLLRKQPPSILQQVHRPLAPAVLAGPSEGIQTLAKTQLSQHAMRMAATPVPSTTIVNTQHVSNAASDDSLVLRGSTKPPPDHQHSAPPQQQALPTTVDHRDHVAQVVHGGGHEEGAIRGVKGKIKQNVNVERFMSKVLTVRH
ncbi:Hypothetical protein, putative [Bodo saltans]|uniref:Uncharacterized protein n=1 Tax=Bodo saltans TaxID=75058 RepID=A0A0S4J415_BODSA|nr:Hypothetical protein, putative [Bodo saltans]|eukprot:CUG86123.1 Hypothetical protein, putative [Bodo saltans]